MKKYMTPHMEMVTLETKDIMALSVNDQLNLDDTSNLPTSGGNGWIPDFGGNGWA